MVFGGLDWNGFRAAAKKVQEPPTPNWNSSGFFQLGDFQCMKEKS
jgi:hypothetical protein